MAIGLKWLEMWYDQMGKRNNRITDYIIMTIAGPLGVKIVATNKESNNWFQEIAL